MIEARLQIPLQRKAYQDPYGSRHWQSQEDAHETEERTPGEYSEDDDDRV